MLRILLCTYWVKQRYGLIYLLEYVNGFFVSLFLNDVFQNHTTVFPLALAVQRAGSHHGHTHV